MDKYNLSIKIRLIPCYQVPCDLVLIETYRNIGSLEAIDKAVKERVSCDAIGPYTYEVIDMQVTYSTDLAKN